MTLDPLCDRLALLVSGLEEAAAGGPSDAVLAAAPTISRWRPVMVGDEPALRGHAPDHPLLRGDDIVTSRLLFLDEGRGTARTVSRWYRLGRRHEDVGPVAQEASPVPDAMAAEADPELRLRLLALRAVFRIPRAASDAEVRHALDASPARLLAEIDEEPWAVAATPRDLRDRLAAVVVRWPLATTGRGRMH